MCISAYLAAARVLGVKVRWRFALKSLDRVLYEACREDEDWRTWSPTVQGAGGSTRSGGAG